MDIFCRGVKPFPPLALTEVAFWLRIMRDHAVFLYHGLPSTDKELRPEARQFYAIFTDLEECAGRAAGEEDFANLVAAATVAVQRFFVFKRRILHLLAECRLCGAWLYPLFVDHLSREALYFRKLLKKFGGCGMPCQVDAVGSEHIFWARGIADHMKFVRDLVDPSERALLSMATATGQKFDLLNLQARDIASMLWHYRPNNDLVRFAKDFRTAVQDANDFAATAGGLVACCTAATVIPPLLADHVRREGVHCMEVLELIRRYLLAGDDGLEGEQDDDEE